MKKPSAWRTWFPAMAGVVAIAIWAACDGDAPTAAPRDVEAATAAAALPVPDAGIRPNLSARGLDPAGRPFRLQYQPDWVSRITVTERPAGANPVTAVLFRNDGYRLRDPGPVVRTRISSPEHGLDFEVIINDPAHVVKRVTVETVAADGASDSTRTEFTIEDWLPPPPPPDTTVH